MIGTSITHNGIKVFITPEWGSPVPVGLIKDKILTVTDIDNLYTTKGYTMLGLDSLILESKNLDYMFIQFKYKNTKLRTLREFFLSIGQHKELHNGRHMLFIDIKKLNMDTAIKWLKQKNQKQLSLFSE